jgi:hypothetical protein
MEVKVFDLEATNSRIETLNMCASEDSIRYAKHLFPANQHNRAIKEIGYIIGCYRSDEPTADIVKEAQSFMDKMYSIVDATNISSMATDALINILRASVKDEELSSFGSTVVSTIVAKLEYQLLHISGNVGGMPIEVDDLLEDWDEVKLVLRNNRLEGFVLTELDRFSASIINSIGNRTTKLEVNELDGNKVCLFTVLYTIPLIYYTAFGLRKYSKPGVVSIKAGVNQDFPILASIANEFGLAYFKLFTDNPNRVDGCVSVFVNKITSDITLYI